MEENMVFTEEDIERLRIEFNIPENVNLNYRRLNRLYFKSVAKEILGHDPHPRMEPDDGKEEKWRVLIKKDLLPCCDGNVPILNIPCSVKRKGITIEFHGTIEDALHQLYAIENYVKERSKELVQEELILV